MGFFYLVIAEGFKQLGKTTKVSSYCLIYEGCFLCAYMDSMGIEKADFLYHINQARNSIAGKERGN